ncbi:MAG: hypothetical protein M1834_004258 [Cirrosporium novae-zelandiae]|nr:MAG: hypothetical protein M1834_004258 [Cirrosporium novae-zelandiae]
MPHQICLTLSPKKCHQSNNQMDIPQIEVIKTNGDKLSLQTNLENVVQALEKDGCLLLKNATSRISPHDVSFFKSHARDIILHSSVKAILFSAQPDEDFAIVHYMLYKFGQQPGKLGRDKRWKEMAAVPGVVAINCVHLQEDAVFEIDKCGRKKDTGDTITMRANAGDIFIHCTWLNITPPHREVGPPDEGYAIVVSYLWLGFSEDAWMRSTMAEMILHVAGEDCFRSKDLVIWKRPKEKPQ